MTEPVSPVCRVACDIPTFLFEVATVADTIVVVWRALELLEKKFKPASDGNRA